MKSIIEFVKTSLIGGLLVVLPVWLSVLLLVKSVGMLALFFKPVIDHLPEGARHPFLLSGLILVLGCFAVGLIMRTTLGRVAQRAIRTRVLDRIPGYGVIRGMTQQFAHLDQGAVFAPCLAEIEDALVPAFAVEHHADGRCTVFVPSSPTPFAGAIYILSAERVHPVDVSVLKVMGCVSKWGSGSGELLAGMQATQSSGTVAERPMVAALPIRETPRAN